MAIQGLTGTGDFVGTSNLTTLADQTGGGERPLNWREGILMRFPNGSAPLTALTSQMKKKVTDDPVFNWWEREVSDIRLELDQDLNNTDLKDAIVNIQVIDTGAFGGAFQVKTGDLLYVEETGEILRVSADGADTSATFDVSRAWGDVVPTALVRGTGVNPHMVIIGSSYGEGSDTPQSIRYRPTKHLNYTQIFRDSLKATRTAMQTRLRTVDEVRDAKTQALLYHSMRMEYAFLFGDPREDVDPVNGEPLRTTGGAIGYATDAGNTKDIAANTNSLGQWNEIEDAMLEAFRFGSQEKLCFLGNRAMLAIQRMIRLSASTSVELTPMQKEFGMDVRRLFTSSGTLVLKTHPLLSQIQSLPGATDFYHAWDTWMVILDMGNLTYRPLRNSDTQYLPDRQNNGIDGLTSEYLTEAGLEVNHGKTHYVIKGVADATVEGTSIEQVDLP